MRGFWPKTCRPEANKAPHRTREKTSGTRDTRGLLGGGNLFIDDVLIYVHGLCAKNYRTRTDAINSQEVKLA